VKAATLPFIVVSLVAALLSPPVSRADEDWQTLIHQALDQPTDLEIADQPIADALAYVGQRTGVSIDIAPAVVEMLPYGAKTTVSATIRGTPLRDGLSALLRPIGLQFAIRGSQIQAEPVPALARLGRRATWEELELLDQLASSTWWGGVAEQLRITVEGELLSADDAIGTLRERAGKVGAGTALDAIEQACAALRWAWIPRGRQVVVMRATDFYRDRLGSTDSFRYVGVPLANVLVDLTHRAGVPLRMEPGVLADLPTQTLNSFTLQAENMPYDQAMELIAGATALAYTVSDEGVWIYRPEGSAASAAAPRSGSADPYVMKITMPAGADGTSYEILVRQSELPPELLEIRKQRIDTAIHELTGTIAP
jgi:hypothetical protein